MIFLRKNSLFLNIILVISDLDFRSEILEIYSYLNFIFISFFYYSWKIYLLADYFRLFRIVFFDLIYMILYNYFILLF